MSLDPERLAALDEALSFLGDRLERERPLGPLSTYRVGGPARRFVEVGRRRRAGPDRDGGGRSGIPRRRRRARGRPGLEPAGRRPGGRRRSCCSWGRGSPPSRCDGDVVRAGGAASLPVLARRTVAAGLTGFEWAVGVPGSVGGAVRMNAGGHGADMAASLLGVRVVDLSSGEDVEVDASALHLGYRRSSLRRSQVVVHADLQLAPGDVGCGRGDAVARSSGGVVSTSPAARTPDRCSPTRPATRPAG